MRSLEGFTDAQVSGRLNGMPDAELGTLLGPDTSGGHYIICAVTDKGTCLMRRASTEEILLGVVRSEPRSLTEKGRWAF